MKHYKSLKELLTDWEQLPSLGTIYAKSLNESEIENQGYWVYSNEEQEKEETIETKNGDLIPKSLQNHKARSVFETATLKAIIKNKLKHNPKLTISSTNEFIDAINYYLDNDDFLD